MKVANRKPQWTWWLHLLGASEALLLAMALGVPGLNGALLGVALVVGVIFIVSGIVSTRGFFNPLGWILVWVVIATLGLQGLLFRAALWASRPALHQAAVEVDAAGRPSRTGLIGLFRFSSVEPFDGAVVFTFSKKETPWGRRGIYFSFNHEPIDRSYFYSQEELSGGWYLWHYGGW
ncbi:MAG: hypothetical protein AAGI48_16195 [Verrucomicrobiota bacterium]